MTAQIQTPPMKPPTIKVSELWEQYMKDNIPAHASKGQLRVMKHAFYTGLATFYNLITQTEWDDNTIIAVGHELTEFYTIKPEEKRIITHG